MSRASPTLPIDPAIPEAINASVNASDLYCDPASEWWISPVAVNAALPRRRVNSACSSAELTSGVVFGQLTRQPRIRRE